MSATLSPRSTRSTLSRRAMAGTPDRRTEAVLRDLAFVFQLTGQVKSEMNRESARPAFTHPVADVAEVSADPCVARRLPG